MDELIRRITANVGISDELARQAVGIILSFLQSAGPKDAVRALMNAIPGAEDAAADLPKRRGSLFGIMGAMGAMNELTSIGLDLSQVMQVTKDVVAFAKEQAGEEPVNRVLAAIPGLGQFA